MVLPLMLLGIGCQQPAPNERPTEAQREEIRQVERERLRSLVSVDLAAARQLHADDFQLINPAGMTVSRDEYLSQLESGQLDYRAWEPGAITVRVYGDVAVIRYRDARFDVDLGGRAVHRGPMHHTNVYERRSGRWQVVWSQASGQFAPPPPD